MAQQKKQGSDETPEVLAEMAVHIIMGILMISTVLIGALAMAMASMSRKLKSEGWDLKTIAVRKLRMLLGLLPFMIILAVVLDYRLPEQPGAMSAKKIAQVFINGDTDKDILEQKVKDIKHEIGAYEKRVDRILNNPQEQQNGPELESYLRYGKGLEKRYLKARSELAAYNRKLQGSSSQSIAARVYDGISGQRLLDFIFFGLIFLALSFALSYVVEFFMGDDPSKGIYAMGSLFGRLFSPFIYVGPMPWELLGKFKIGHTLKGSPAIGKNILLGTLPNAYLTERNFNYHVQIIGGSGAGKTNLLKVMIEDRVRRGHSVLFFDFKADIELMDWMTGLATDANRIQDLEMISMSDPKMSFAYNPIATGSETEISSQIMNSLNWSEEFYRNTSESALMIILKVMCFIRDRTGRPFTLGDLYLFFTSVSYRMDVIAEASKRLYPEIYRADLRRISEELATNKKDHYQGLVSQLSKILNSSAGEIVSVKCEHEVEFSFEDAMKNGKIAYLFMNSLKLKETASIVGKMMLQDLMKTVGNIYDDRNYIKRPTTLIIDEFASFATPDFGEFIEKARGAGISIVVAYQSRKSLDHIEENLALKINENTATKIVFQVQDSDDAEWFCGLMGTKRVQKETHQTEEDLFFGDQRTGMKSVRQVEEFVVHPNVIKRLQTGQALLVCSKVDPHHAVMNIKLANQYAEQYARVPALKPAQRSMSASSGSNLNQVSRSTEELRPQDLI